MTTVVHIKLDRTNYPLWLAQILPILKSRDLMGYVDGSLVCPPKHLLGVTTVYTSWVQQDQMILSWINGSLTILFCLWWQENGLLELPGKLLSCKIPHCSRDFGFHRNFKVKRVARESNPIMGDPLGSSLVSSQKQNREGIVEAQSEQYRATMMEQARDVVDPGQDVT
ncbi:hypothetical protein DVH24_032279 [Malus domestica]|uniref:Retrotransposon Copia-like N-terminal domain-containing protein n=1 Tax=Malus domestica TaxID=3750 RepID=A0A498J7S7_MALDO|nr:hypothetical protein DVH24_032279 [Malus domestica]